MKKLVYALFTLLIAAPLVSAEVILAPQWSEICPPSYVNVQSAKFDSNKKYWYERKSQFDESISQCGKYTGDDLKSCYSQVKEAELAKNRIWNAKVEAQKESLEKQIEYNNTQRTFNSINKLIDKL